MHPDQVTAWLEGLNISPKARAQELNLEAWVQMAETFGQGSEETT
jgi:hypothetical protein